jgi:hypothetical protein
MAFDVVSRLVGLRPLIITFLRVDQLCPMSLNHFFNDVPVLEIQIHIHSLVEIDDLLELLPLGQA